jgi:hypothetical protein
VYPKETLQHVSAEGTPFARHLLGFELKLHLALQNRKSAPIIPIVGVYEKRLGIGANEREVYILAE